MSINSKVVRGQIKSKVTRYRKFFDDLDKEDLSETNISQLKLRYEKVEPLLEEFERVQAEVLNEFPEEINGPDQWEFEENYFNLLGDMKCLLDKYDTKNASNTNVSNIIPQNNNNRYQLPPIELPKFSGKYDEWEEFKNAFLAVVDSDSSLSNSQKFFYLRSVLSSDVLEVIKSLQVTDSNYLIAWNLLEGRYENKALIIHNHIKSIVEYPPMKFESYKQLRSLYDNFNRHLRCLEILGENVKAWDRIILYILSKKFDNTTRRDWEIFKYVNELPDLNDLRKFLNNKCDLLEKMEIHKGESSDKNKKRHFEKKEYSSQTFVSNHDDIICSYCQSNHSIKNCVKFLQLSITQRINKIKEKRLCLNCFKKNHLSINCKAPKCNKCQKPHNILLHLEFSNNVNPSHNSVFPGTNQAKPSGSALIPTNNIEQMATGGGSQPLESGLSQCVSHLTLNNENFNSFSGNASDIDSKHSQVLLSTAIVNILHNGLLIPARVLLDSGSTTNFIREDFCNKIGLRKYKTNHIVNGIGQNAVNLNMQTNISISSNYDVFSTKINCLVIPKITDKLPRLNFDKNIIKIPNSFVLADPHYNVSSEIDLLLGSQFFWEIMRHGQYKLGKNMPILQKTALGWVIAGNLMLCNNQQNVSNRSLSLLTVNEKIDVQVSKFWALEEITNNRKIFSDAEKYCEINFENTTKRNSDGRFIVDIPFKESVSKLGNSSEMALKRFRALENKLLKNDNLRHEYISFIEEYQQLGHMTEIDSDSVNLNNGYFLPHHAVIKATSLTTKCRVVFDASAKTDTGVSLNDVQFTGPALQNDIFSILVRFRKFQYVMTSDISKMYRQILINENQTCYQKIFWRSKVDEPVKIFKLNTVTYGCASAPYLAVRSILQLAKDFEVDFPEESKIIANSFYIDDLLTGADSKEKLIQLQRNISKILDSAGFELRKWLCNDYNILNQFSINEKLPISVLQIAENSSSNKTLGISWNAHKDIIKYSICDFDNNITQISKRKILSLVCQIYDPLGLLGPIIIVAKILLQDLWKTQCSWDENVPEHLFKKWLNFQNNLKHVNDIDIPRCACLSNYITIELHGFADASMKAFGVCLYIRCVNETKNIIAVNLLCSKSRVAPIQSVTLPRLELSACALLANLAKKCLDCLEINFTSQYYWTDSSVTLAWLKGDITKWKTFVANRVSEINGLINKSDWYHIRTEENPADLISRGCLAKILCTSELWWQGPKWLQLPKSDWVMSKINLNFDIPEQKLESCELSLVIVKNDNVFLKLIENHSSFNKLLRVCAYVLKFINLLKNKRVNKTPKKENIKENLNAIEIENALLVLVKVCQIYSFPEEYNNLLEGKPLNKKSKLLCLNPFIDNSVIRVGGRLQHSKVSYDKKHQIVLPNSNHLTDLILRNEHYRLLHCGVQQLICSVREKFWPLSARNSCKKIIKRCVVCFRAKPKVESYLMGNLPNYRVNLTSPFINVGVDYAGPFLLKDRQTRNPKIIKAYVCLFICMSTKCVHLELVTELTTNAFLNTFKRFISRRGRPCHIFSDNGRNFVGANSAIQKLYDFIDRESQSIGNELVNERIQWHFIPARSPSFGGLWEAGIKCAKFHLVRVLQGHSLTYEQFSTLLTGVEGILNSRPLCQLTNDPDDLSALTPAHFLIGRSLTALPEVNLQHVPENRLTKYQHMQALLQHFWCRWHKEYLNELQGRIKWQQTKVNIKIGALVLLKDENTPTFQWQLARVTALHPGSDGVVRVVDVKTKGGVFRRAVNKVCLVPIE